MGKFYKYFIKKNFLKVSFLLLPGVFNLNILRKILETLAYPERETDYNIPKSELLSMAIDKIHQGKGIGKILFEELSNKFEKMGVREFKVIVGRKLDKACKFYEKMGCKVIGEIEIHKGETSKIYI